MIDYERIRIHDKYIGARTRRIGQQEDLLDIFFVAVPERTSARPETQGPRNKEHPDISGTPKHKVP